MPPERYNRTLQETQAAFDRLKFQNEVDRLQGEISFLKNSLRKEKERADLFEEKFEAKESELHTQSEQLNAFPASDPNVDDVDVGITQTGVAELVFGIAHQVRNPLSIAKSNTQMLMELSNLTDDEKQHLEIILRQLNSLEARVEQMKLLSQPLQPIMRTHDLADLVDKTVSVLDERAGAQNVKISAPSKGFRAVSVNVDEKMIVEAMLNIGLNAVESMPAGGAVEITVTEDVPNKKVWVSFRDAGCGMDRDTLYSAGKPFFTTKEKSLGVGLARTRRIIAAHGGKLNISSMPNCGTTVTLVLPVDPATFQEPNV